MHILLTGATGYIGSAVARALLTGGHRVSISQRAGSNYARLADVKSRLSVFAADASDPAAPFRQAAAVDVVIHCATNYGRNGEGDTTLLRSNVLYPLDLLNLAIQHGVKAFINTDTVLPEFVNPYAITKHQFSQWGRLYSSTGKIRFINLKLHNAYGPSDDFSKFTSWIIRECVDNTPIIRLTDGKQERDFVYIDDVVAAYLLIVEKLSLGDAQWLELVVGTGKPVSIRSFAEAVHRMTESRSFLDFGALPNRPNENISVSSDLVQLLQLGWRPATSLEAGLRRTIEYHRATHPHDECARSYVLAHDRIQMHAMPIRLSICIPTFNRAFYLMQLIQSILLQDSEELEIVISDNASNDETMEVVDALRSVHGNIRYIRSESNVGADRNLLNAVSNARGEYCWLMGSDDIVEPGAVQAVLAVLGQRANLAGISVNLNIYTRDLVLLKNAVPVAGGKLTTDRLFRNREECFSVLGLYFGYFSGQIVNRRLWDDVVFRVDADRYCTGFVLVYIIGHMLRVNPDWYFLSARCVGNRTGNDSILDAVGFYQRQVIAHDVFERSLRALFPRNSAVYRNVLKLALSTYIMRDCVGYKASGLGFGTLWSLILLYTKIYKTFALYWCAVFPILISPRWVIKASRRLFRLLPKRHGHV